MTERFLDKYRISSARLQNWDYGWNGIYFITICTEGRDNYFGKISEQVMELSEIGLFAQKFWFDIPNHFTFVDLDAFVVMPNHIHGIIMIDKTGFGKEVSDFDGNMDADFVDIGITPGQQRFRNPGRDNLSSIVGSYKSAVSKQAHPINTCFGWQTRFYEHIVQSDREFERIRDYIHFNPVNWEKDKYFGNR